MSKAKKTKLPQRPTALDRITAKLRAALQSQTKNLIEIGKLLIESREHLEHGDWQAWLTENFDLSYRTAHRYVGAAEYVAAKSDTVSDFANLSPTVLYELAEGRYDEKEEAAILAATRERRVDEGVADAICEKLAPPANDADDAGDAGDDQADGDHGDGDGDHDDDAIAAAKSAAGAKEDAEIAAILDGPPTAPPPPPTDYALLEFNNAIAALRRLLTKQAAQFASSLYGADDLESVESFIRAVIKAKTKTTATAEVASAE
jgi:hypothetical protein